MTNIFLTEGDWRDSLDVPCGPLQIVESASGAFCFIDEAVACDNCGRLVPFDERLVSDDELEYCSNGCLSENPREAFLTLMEQRRDEWRDAA